MTTSAIEARDLHVQRRGKEVLHGLTFTVTAGQITGLLGPSGCGKSTLLRSVVGVQAGASGALSVLGRPAGHADLRRRIGYVTQSPAVYADLTVRRNLQYFAVVAGASAVRVDEVLADVDLVHAADARVDRLSGGQQARVSLATALLAEPELLVLDEPTVGLDPVLRRDLWRLFRGLADRGRTLVVSSHVMDEASRCDRLLLLRDGHLVADDTLDGVLARTGAHDVEGAFLVLAAEVAA
jgi:ABC-2 type transport system ATP-binding protein